MLCYSALPRFELSLAFHGFASPCFALCCIALRCSALPFHFAMHCLTLLCIALHCFALLLFFTLLCVAARNVRCETFHFAQAKQFNTTRYDATQSEAIRTNPMHSNVVSYKAMWCKQRIMWCNTRHVKHCTTMRRNATQWKANQCNATRSNATQCKQMRHNAKQCAAT